MAKRKTVQKPAVRRTAVTRVESTAVTVREPEHPMAIIERVAKDRSVDVAKLAQLIELQKDMLRTQAKIDFDQEFARMAPALPTIRKGGTITNKDKSPRSRYARLSEDIHPAIKPILTAHGFAIRHKTEWPALGQVRVIGVLAHRSGHSETSTFEGPADASDYRTHVQSLGSTVTYGRRYTTIDLLNLTIHGTDDDGQRASVTRQPPAPRTEPRPSAPPVQAPRASQHAQSRDVITEPQRKRLWVVIKNSGRDEQAVREWLHARYGWTSSKAITRDVYDDVCAAIESPADLPAVAERIPGEDG